MRRGPRPGRACRPYGVLVGHRPPSARTSTEDHVLRLPSCSFDFRRRFPAPDGLSKPTRALFVFRVVSTRVINAAAPESANAVSTACEGADMTTGTVKWFN